MKWRNKIYKIKWNEIHSAVENAANKINQFFWLTISAFSEVSLLLTDWWDMHECKFCFCFSHFLSLTENCKLKVRKLFLFFLVYRFSSSKWKFKLLFYVRFISASKMELEKLNNCFKKNYSFLFIFFPFLFGSHFSSSASIQFGGLIMCWWLATSNCKCVMVSRIWAMTNVDFPCWCQSINTYFKF